MQGANLSPALPNRTFGDDTRVPYRGCPTWQPPDTGLLSPGNVASEGEELNFKLYAVAVISDGHSPMWLLAATLNGTALVRRNLEGPLDSVAGPFPEGTLKLMRNEAKKPVKAAFPRGSHGTATSRGSGCLLSPKRGL